MTKEPPTLRKLAAAYAHLSIDCCHAGAQFETAAKALRDRQLEKAEVAIKEGLDTLSKIVLDVPRIEEETA